MFSNVESEVKFSALCIDVCVLPACVVVERQAVWPAQISVNENLPVRTVQMSSLDLRNVTPVRPEQESGQNHEMHLTGKTIKLLNNDTESL